MGVTVGQERPMSDLNKPLSSFSMAASGSVIKVDKGPPHLTAVPRAQAQAQAQGPFLQTDKGSHFCLLKGFKPFLLLEHCSRECSLHTRCLCRGRDHKCNLVMSMPSKAKTTKTGKGTN